VARRDSVISALPRPGLWRRSLTPGDDETAAPPTGETMLASSAWSLVSLMATTVFTAVLTLYLVRALGPGQYGVFALAVGVGGFLFLPADFGTSASTARFLADHRGDREQIATIVAEGLKLKLIVSSIVCGALVALAGPIAAAYHAPLTWPLRAVAIAVFGQSMMLLFEGVFVADRNVATNARLTFVESAAEFGASIAFVLTVGGAAGAAAGRAVGYGCGAALAMMLGARSFGWPSKLRHRGSDGSSRRRIARYAVPLMLVDGSYTLFTVIDLVLIGAILGTRQVGLFSAPLRLFSLLVYPGNAIATGVAPRMSRGLDTASTSAEARASTAAVQGAVFGGALRRLIVFQSLFLAPLIVWARPLVDILLSSGYHGSVGTLRVLSICVYLGGLAPLLSVSVNYLGDAKSRVPLMLGAALLDTAIDIVLIPRIGIVSGAIATAAGLLLMDAGHLWICRRHLTVSLAPLALSAVRGLMGAASMAAVMLAIGTDPSPPALAFGGVASLLAFAVTIALLGELTPSDLRTARRWAVSRFASR
jgi:O-antigen/teichoic acid export membrane protein